MVKLSPLEKWFFTGEGEDFEQRCRERLSAELEINDEGIEVVLQMRRQLVELQALVRRMEIELAAHHAALDVRLGGYQEEYFEAYWYELGDESDPGEDHGM